MGARYFDGHAIGGPLNLDVRCIPGLGFRHTGSEKEETPSAAGVRHFAHGGCHNIRIEATKFELYFASQQEASGELGQFESQVVIR